MSQAQNNKFTVYADLNCPFCFALHERLHGEGLLHRVAWKLIEHAPNIRYDVSDVQVHAELHEEVTKLREIADDVSVIVPPSRPNSKLAIKMTLAAEAVDQEKAATFRLLLYRSLWVEGQDFGDAELLEKLRIEAGLPTLPVDESVDEHIARWQLEWEKGDFSRNIPVLVTNDENKLLGLPSLDVIQAFLFGDANEVAFDEGAICYLKPREKVLIVSNDAAVMNGFADALDQQYHLEFAQYGDAAFQSCCSNNPPDLVLMAIDTAEPNGFDTCLNIKDHEQSQKTAVILFGSGHKVSDEVHAFDCGAADYIRLPCANEVLRARVRVMLRLKRTTDLLEQYSRLDSLTEIPNRREFDRTFEKEWRRGIRSRKPLSLMLLDVDYFKPFNDNYGHMEGDQCLKKVAQVIENTIRRPPDLVARYGGEEFVIILPETDATGAEQVAKNIQQALHAANVPHEYSTVSDRLTASIGICSILPTNNISPKHMLDNADTALYKAKDSGRNRIVVAKPGE